MCAFGICHGTPSWNGTQYALINPSSMAFSPRTRLRIMNLGFGQRSSSLSDPLARPQSHVTTRSDLIPTWWRASRWSMGSGATVQSTRLSSGFTVHGAHAAVPAISCRPAWAGSAGRVMLMIKFGTLKNWTIWFVKLEYSVLTVSKYD
jgi:hypothetical protein